MLQMVGFQAGQDVPAGGRLFDFPAGTLPETMRPSATITLTTFLELTSAALLTVSSSGAIYMTVNTERKAAWGNYAAATWVTA